MKTFWMITTCLLLLGCAVGAQAVEYTAGQPLWLSVKSSKLQTTPGIPVRIAITYGDKDYAVAANGVIQQTIDDPVTLTWQATGGQLSKWSHGDTQPVELSFVALQPGYYAILLTADDSGRFADEPPQRKIVEIAVLQKGVDIVPTLRVGANPQTIQLHRYASSTITAQVLGRDVAGKEVKFFTTSGTLSAATAVTNAQGLASVQLTATTRDIGTATVIAYSGNGQSSTTVEIIDRAPRPRQPDPAPVPPPLPTYQPDFLISVDPPTLPADGRSTADVTVRLTDGLGRGLFQRVVDFSAPNVAIRPLRMITDINGYARVQLVAPTTPGQALIFAASGAQRSYAVVTFTAPMPKPTGVPRLFLTVHPTSVPADGASKLLLSVLVLDSNGFAVPNAAIDFASTLGSVLYPRVITDQNGQAGTYITAPTAPGIAAVSASYGDVTAASQVTFQGAQAAGGSLDIRSWSGQQMIYAAEKWYFRTIIQPTSSMSALIILDDNGKAVKQIDLGKSTILVRDQYGAARGYGTEEGATARIEILKPDGSSQRVITLDLPVGSHLREVQYAEPAGNVLATLAAPDGSQPEVHFFAAGSKPVLSLQKGLERMPVLALGGDGYLAIALAGGMVQVYNPNGQKVTEIRRAGLPVTHIALGPESEWVAVAVALAGQEETPPRVLVYSRQGALLVDLQQEGLGLAPAGKDGLFINAPDSTRFVSLKTRNIAWTLPGGFERVLVQKDTAVLAGRLRDPRLDMIISHVTIVRINDGTVLGGQTFAEDFREFRAILPPDDKGQVGIITNHYTFRFPLPQEK